MCSKSEVIITKEGPCNNSHTMFAVQIVDVLLEYRTICTAKFVHITRFCRLLHCPSKCLVWVKKCRHVWLDQNFDPSSLTKEFLLVFMGKKQKKNGFFSKEKNSKYTSHSAYVATDTKSNGAKINGF